MKQNNGNAVVNVWYVRKGETYGRFTDVRFDDGVDVQILRSALWSSRLFRTLSILKLTLCLVSFTRVRWPRRRLRVAYDYRIRY